MNYYKTYKHISHKSLNAYKNDRRQKQRHVVCGGVNNIRTDYHNRKSVVCVGHMLDIRCSMRLMFAGETKIDIASSEHFPAATHRIVFCI